jgi:DNA (cytosine-5)-methyltransferase 1
MDRGRLSGSWFDVSRPRLLDLFCGAGGAAMGYYRAGFDVVGVDIRPQPRYPFEFHQGDAMTWPLEGFDVIHASPPCQAFSRARAVHKKEHPDLLTPTRPRLAAAGVPYVLENVDGAPLRADLTLCGTMFGLSVRRHRHFESSADLGWPPFACACEGQSSRGFLFNLHNTVQRTRFMDRHPQYPRGMDAMLASYGVPWMLYDEAQEAIPPAYTEWIGARLLEALTVAA